MMRPRRTRKLSSLRVFKIAKPNKAVNFLRNQGNLKGLISPINTFANPLLYEIHVRANHVTKVAEIPWRISLLIVLMLLLTSRRRRFGRPSRPRCSYRRGHSPENSQKVKFCGVLLEVMRKLKWGIDLIVWWKVKCWLRIEVIMEKWDWCDVIMFCENIEGDDGRQKLVPLINLCGCRANKWARGTIWTESRLWKCKWKIVSLWFGWTESV